MAAKDAPGCSTATAMAFAAWLSTRRAKSKGVTPGARQLVSGVSNCRGVSPGVLLAPPTAPVAGFPIGCALLPAVLVPRLLLLLPLLLLLGMRCGGSEVLVTSMRGRSSAQGEGGDKARQGAQGNPK
jgi:hypothetical protein